MKLRFLTLCSVLSCAASAQNQSATQHSTSLTSYLQSIWHALVAFWHFQITQIDGHPITIGKLVQVLVLLLFGIWLARILSRTVVQKIMRQFGLNDSAIGAFRSTSVAFGILVVYFSRTGNMRVIAGHI